jgi:hypothetical protein
MPPKLLHSAAHMNYSQKFWKNSYTLVYDYFMATNRPKKNFNFNFLHPTKTTGRPKLSPAAKKRKEIFKKIAKKLRSESDARYAIITASGEVQYTFYEFSGPGGAKEALDTLELPPGTAVVRICDGIELSHRTAFSVAV